MAIILQNPILTSFVYPFLLIFFITFAILEKSKLFGEEKRQINALVSFVVGLIFVTALSSLDLVSNLILFLSIALIIVFILMLLWGFVYSGKEGFVPTKTMKLGLGAVITISVVIAVIWVAGVGGKLYNFFFEQSWSSSLWTNVIFLILIGVALAAVINFKSSGK